MSLWEQALVLGLSLIMLLGIVTGVSEYYNNARTDDTQAKVADYLFAIEQYKYEMGEYPATLNELTEAKDNGQYGPWINDNFKDSWGHDFKYAYSEKDGFIVYSLGRKGEDNSSLSEGIGKGNIGKKAK